MVDSLERGAPIYGRRYAPIAGLWTLLGVDGIQ